MPLFGNKKTKLIMYPFRYKNLRPKEGKKYIYDLQGQKLADGKSANSYISSIVNKTVPKLCLGNV